MKYVNKILTALNNAGQITNFKRTGLRYINQVYIPSCTLTKLLSHFDNSLTAISSKFFKDEKCLARQIGQTILNRDGFKVIFNHGIFNPDFPSNIVRNEFVLDYDCFSDAIEYNEYQAIIEKMHLEIQNLFEKLQRPMISPANSQYHNKVFVCLGSTIGNFDNGNKIFKVFSTLAAPGDRLLVGYQTNKYLPVIFEKYQRHAGYRTLIGNFLPPGERQKIEWRLNTKASSVEAWYKKTQLFRSKKYSSKEVASCAKHHDWKQQFLLTDSFGNVCLHGFQKF